MVTVKKFLIVNFLNISDSTTVWY